MTILRLLNKKINIKRVLIQYKLTMETCTSMEPMYVSYGFKPI